MNSTRVTVVTNTTNLICFVTMQKCGEKDAKGRRNFQILSSMMHTQIVMKKMKEGSQHQMIKFNLING